MVVELPPYFQIFWRIQIHSYLVLFVQSKENWWEHYGKKNNTEVVEDLGDENTKEGEAGGLLRDMVLDMILCVCVVEKAKAQPQ